MTTRLRLATSRSPRRRRPALLHVVLVLALTGVTWAASGGAGAAERSRTQDDDRAELVRRGRDLFLTGCSSCHGPDGEGVIGPDGDRRGPSLERAGAADAYYQLSTGRMPASDNDERAVRKDPAYAPDEIAALVAYVATIGTGLPIPDIEPARGDLSEGGELFRGNCQPCHSATGAGGALSYGEAAPPLDQSTATQVGAAVRIGPGQMPAFGPEVISPEELDGIARYVEYLQEPDDRGGVPLGRLGPIPEGLVVWVVGIGALLAFCAWIGTRVGGRQAGTP